MKEIAIYGTGVWGNNLYDWLKELDIEISCFLKTVPKDNETFHGLPVLSPKDFFKQKDEVIVIIAIKNRQTVRQIYNSLLNIGFKKNQIINLNNTIYGFILDKVSVKYNCDGGFYCNCCENSVNDFLPYEPMKSEAFNNYRIIGGGYREHAICPICKGIDRHRWQKYVLNKYTDIYQADCNVLHIAPEDHLSGWIRLNSKCDYYMGDIELGKTDHRVDLTDIQFKDQFFDYVIANHVLEHIENLSSAFTEIKRVLKPNGKLIVSFPVCMDIKTKEDKSIVKPEDRLREFGQSDHVRLFGNDYKEYIEKHGFKVEVKSPEDCLTKDMIEKYGLIKDDILLICGKG